MKCLVNKDYFYKMNGIYIYMWKNMVLDIIVYNSEYVI